MFLSTSARVPGQARRCFQSWGCPGRSSPPGDANPGETRAGLRKYNACCVVAWLDHITYGIRSSPAQFHARYISTLVFCFLTGFGSCKDQEEHLERWVWLSTCPLPDLSSCLTVRIVRLESGWNAKLFQHSFRALSFFHHTHLFILPVGNPEQLKKLRPKPIK